MGTYPLQPTPLVVNAPHTRNLSDWLSWLEQRNPNHIELGLARMSAVWRSVQQLYSISLPTVVTVAGTNGKGSSVALLEAIFLAEGYRVGAYTSPHLERFNERMRIQGADCSDDEIVDAMSKLHTIEAAQHLTYFEWATLTALIAFAHAKLDVWVLEVGLGGRLDAVNILDADLALITNIGLDHQAILGTEKTAIAREKAGILRAKQAAVYADPNPEPAIEAHARAIDCPIWIRNQNFIVSTQDASWGLSLAGAQQHWQKPTLAGQMQIDNAAGVVALLQHPGNPLAISKQSIEVGLQTARIIGRYERWMDQDRLIILDVAHNQESVQALIENINTNNQLANGHKRFAVFGALNDKPIGEMIALASPLFHDWFVGYLSSERSASAAAIWVLLPAANRVDMPHETNIHSAYNQALAYSQAGDQIVVFGSFFTVSAIRQSLKQRGARLV